MSNYCMRIIHHFIFISWISFVYLVSRSASFGKSGGKEIKTKDKIGPTAKSQKIYVKNLTSNQKMMKSDECGESLHGWELVCHKQAHKSLSCLSCNKTFLLKSKLISHMKIHRTPKEFGCASCGVIFHTNSELKQHMKNHVPRKEYKCEACEKIFFSNQHLRNHIKTHGKERPYTCDICHKTYKRKYELTGHKKIVHTSDSKHECDICGFSTLYKANLEVHHKRHLNEFRFTCEICKKGFYTNSELQGHKNFHTNEKPHQCDICGKAFLYKSNLWKHQRSNHPGKDSKRYQCSVCGKNFPFKSSLTSHMNTHTRELKFICDVCGKALSSSMSLKAHKRLHTGEKPCICTVCGKAFTKSFTLKVHQLTHTGQKPHSCDICGKSFTQRSTLVVHKRYHTGQRPYQCQTCNRGFVSKTLLNTHQKSHDQTCFFHLWKLIAVPWSHIVQNWISTFEHSWLIAVSPFMRFPLLSTHWSNVCKIHERYNNIMLTYFYFIGFHTIKTQLCDWSDFFSTNACQFLSYHSIFPHLVKAIGRMLCVCVCVCVRARACVCVCVLWLCYQITGGTWLHVFWVTVIGVHCTHKLFIFAARCFTHDSHKITCWTLSMLPRDWFLFGILLPSLYNNFEQMQPCSAEIQ